MLRRFLYLTHEFQNGVGANGNVINDDARLVNQEGNRSGDVNRIQTGKREFRVLNVVGF